MWRIWPAVWQAGGDIITEDGKVGFGGQPGEQAFGVPDRLAQDGSVYVDTKPDSDQTYQLFNNGKIGMVVTGPWQLPDFIEAKIDFGVAPLPTFGGEPLTISGPDTWTLFDNGDKRSKAAIEFIQWLNSPEQDAKWVTKAGSLPLRKGTAEQAVWKEYQDEDPRAVGLPRRARRRAHEADEPRLPADLRGDGAVARRGAARSAPPRRTRWRRRSRRARESSPAGAERRVAVAVERAPSRTQRVLGETPTAWLWVLPAVVIILGLSLLPMGWALLLSFQHNDLVTPSTWVGLDNYQRLLDDATFRGAVQHTLIYTAAFVPLSVAGGLGIALMLNRRIRFVGFYRTLVFVPYIMSATAQGVLFSFVFDSQFGVANAVLDKVGIAPQGFLQDPGQALWVIVLIGLWSGIGFSIVVYLAALQDIPRELVEAASIDGARRWGVFRHVTLPGLTPVTVFLLVWQAFQALQLFDLVYVTTRGGPLQSTTVVVLYVWQQAFQFFNAGYGAAAAYVLAFGLLVVALAWGVYQRRREARFG